VGIAITVGIRAFPTEAIESFNLSPLRAQIKASPGNILDLRGPSYGGAVDLGPLGGVALTRHSLTLSGPGGSYGLSVRGSYTFVIPILSPNPY